MALDVPKCKMKTNFVSVLKWKFGPFTVYYSFVMLEENIAISGWYLPSRVVGLGVVGGGVGLGVVISEMGGE